MKENGYNTNLAAEYHVLSVLYRLGLDAYLTMGNKKAVDVVVDFGNHVCRIDVKGIAGKTLWPMDNFRGARKDHFVVLVSFLNKIKETAIAPECYVAPLAAVERLLYRNPNETRQGITLSKMKAKGKRFHEKWELIK